MQLLKKKQFRLNPDEIKKLRKQRIQLIISGVLLGISFPPFPFPFSILMFASLVPFLNVIRERKTLAELNRAAYLTFFVFSLITLYWVGSWQPTADPFLMISGVMLVFFMPILYMIPTTLYYFSKEIFHSKNTLWLYPFFFVTLEYLHMVNEFSFPWLTLGSGLAKFISFIQIADIVGVLGLSLIVLLINVLLSEAFRNIASSKRKAYSQITLVLVIFIALIIYGVVKISGYVEPEKKIKVGIIQPNIDPWDKWSGGNLDDIVSKYLKLSRQAAAQSTGLLVWPETALPVYLLNGGYSRSVDSIYAFLRETGNYLLTGMPDIQYFEEDQLKPPDVKYAKEGNFYYATYNAIYLLSPNDDKVQKYGKTKLVPFGERVPYLNHLPFLGDLLKWGVGLSGWNVGQDTTVFVMKKKYENSAEIDSFKINGLVCYESLYPDFVSAFVNKGAEFITIVTNDSWYGKLSGPFQHKEIAVLRAVENRRSVLRSANGGISCFINSIGRTIKETEMFATTFIVADISISTEKTFYSENPLIIPVLSSVISIWVTGLFVLFRLKKKLFN